ncbi:proline-rich protein PRCC-like [Diadema antillarum]|uniref:proline-rich protein PRCC-like n=1 Tax=Diadema antillarum TaxID=105358 RepID=UPI003A8541CB
MASLVSYGMGSSDESEESDQEDTSSVPMMSSKTSSGPNASANPSPPVAEKKTSLFASLPKPKLTPGPSPEVLQTDPTDVGALGGSTGSSHSNASEAFEKKSLFSSLPPPKKNTPPVGKTNSAPTSEQATSSGGSSATSSGVSKGLLNLPPPKRKQPVKISLPSLPDPDSDEDEPVEKKTKSTKGVGLFSLLPKPKTASRKEANRILIPHTLTKKPPPPASTSVASAPPRLKPPQVRTSIGSTSQELRGTEANPLVSGYNSDEEDDDNEGQGMNFFSMGGDDNDKIKPVKPVNPVSQIPTVSSSGIPSQTLNENLGDGGEGSLLQSGQVLQPHSVVSRTDDGGSVEGTAAQPHPSEHTLPAAQDQPLVFNPAKSHTASHAPQNYYHGNYSHNTVHSWDASNYNYADSSGVQYHQSYDQLGGQGSSGVHYYNQPFQEGLEGEASGAGVPQVQNSDTMEQQLLQDKEFAKMVGKSNRGREAIQIIDINADDQIGPTSGLQQMVKSMTEETEYRGKLKKEQLPTSQQKRKHQITYLARQAKERELELKNQWADNRMTRKQTQAKYGF